MPIEYEIKLRGSHRDLLSRLRAIGAKPAGERVLQDDLVFDSANQRIRSGGGLLRLRHMAAACVLTLKGPSDEHGEVKARTELESGISDPTAMHEILGGLGFRPVLRYQKYRTRFTCPVDGCEGVILTLDETPIGVFLEVEGDPEHIHRTAAALGFSRENYETRSYLEIHRSEGGTGDMVFDDTTLSTP